MVLYDRDYTKFLNEDEKCAFELEEEIQKRKGPINTNEFPRFSHPDKDVRDFVWHKRSLFPNNHFYLGQYSYLDFDKEANNYNKIVYESENERDIQQYIKSGKRWYIPGTILLDYNFGHHDAYLFPEQKLGNDYIVDYMLIGKNSDGYNAVLVEFENSNTKYCRDRDNMESEKVREGLTQIKDWQRWMNQCRDYFLKNVGLSKVGIDIPVYRIYYYLVVSRRDLMDDIAYEVRSQSVYDLNNVKIATFDRLEDNIRMLKQHTTW